MLELWADVRDKQRGHCMLETYESVSEDDDALDIQSVKNGWSDWAECRSVYQETQPVQDSDSLPSSLDSGFSLCQLVTQADPRRGETIIHFWLSLVNFGSSSQSFKMNLSVKIFRPGSGKRGWKTYLWPLWRPHRLRRGQLPRLSIVRVSPGTISAVASDFYVKANAVSYNMLLRRRLHNIDLISDT